jgi:hypothetical protein
MAGYEFGFLMEQSLGHVTLAKNLVANVAFSRHTILGRLRWTPVLDEVLDNLAIARMVF